MEPARQFRAEIAVIWVAFWGRSAYVAVHHYYRGSTACVAGGNLDLI
jgi:hypothetical protein